LASPEDREEVAALDEVFAAPGHVVAQVVEAEFVVGAVGDVGRVLLAADLRGLAGDDRAGRHAEGAVDAAHELGLVGGQVVVDRDDVHALAGDRVEVHGEGRGQGLALTGLHLGDVAEVQGRAAHDLHVVRPLTQRPLGGFAHRRERLGHELVERLSRLVPGAQLGGLATQLVIGQLRVVLFEGVHRLDDLLEAPEDASFAGAKQFLEGVGHGRSPSVGYRRRPVGGCPRAAAQAYSAMLSACDLGDICMGPVSPTADKAARPAGGFCEAAGNSGPSRHRGAPRI
jgi:hypothetical protein